MKKPIGKFFTVDSGQLEITSLDSTRDFVAAEVGYLASFVDQIADALGGEGPATIIHKADDVTVACRVDEIEFHQMSSGKGLITERKSLSVEDLISQLSVAA